MVPEAVPTFVVVRIAKQIVMKRPEPSGFTNEVPDLIRPSAPEAAHAAAGAIALPVAFADPVVLAKRRRELVAPLAASVGKVVIACKLQADFVEAIKVLLRS